MNSKFPLISHIAQLEKIINNKIKHTNTVVRR
jgi:hypothetical protein